jgi:CubicO group peptidase (beta-lactamase class C family)
VLPRLMPALAMVLLACEGSPPARAPGTPDRGGADAAAADAGPPDGGNADSGTADAGPLFPIPDWAEGAPESQGIDSAGLDIAATVAEQNKSLCLLVIRHGVLVSEHYWNGSDRTTANLSWSVAKSYTSTLVGIALDRGDIHSLDDSAATYLPQWRGSTREAITIRNLLSMTSGLSWNVFEDYVELATLAPNETQFALQQPAVATPGTQWTYDNGAVQIFDPIFRSATGITIEEYAGLHLWPEIGMQARWAHDPSGNPTPYANVLATCRDHARLGYLYLHQGNWAGRQVLSSTYVAEAIRPSQSINLAYGMLWWVNAGTPAEDALMQPWPGPMVPFAPEDLFAARGFGNQFIDVIPSLDLVVVRFGLDPLGHDADGGFADGGFDLPGLLTDSKFGVHDEILAPILRAVQP